MAQATRLCASFQCHNTYLYKRQKFTETDYDYEDWLADFGIWQNLNGFSVYITLLYLTLG